MIKSKIIGSAHFNAGKIVPNSEFNGHHFFDEQGRDLPDTERVIEKFKQITGIVERRYSPTEYVASDLGYFAAEAALQDADCSKEQIDYIIVAHNYGDVPFGSTQSDTVPSLASRIKHKLGIRNVRCIPYDILFGCAGWNEALIQADAFIRAGLAKRCLVIAAETLSRVTDPSDRDSMIFSDGAAAVVLEETQNDQGILGSVSVSYTMDELNYIHFGETYNTQPLDDRHYIKMKGRKIYEFALTYVPDAMKSCLEQTGVDIRQVKKIFLHQANEKMNQAILERFYKLYDLPLEESVMPMNIQTYGNNSVATVPTLFDQVRREEIPGHTLHSGDIILFASVGAGMSINAITYQY